MPLFNVPASPSNLLLKTVMNGLEKVVGTLIQLSRRYSVEMKFHDLNKTKKKTSQ